MKTDLILDALEHALWLRGKPQGVIHHSDRGTQYLSIRYTDRLTEVIHKNGPWRGLDDVEKATLT